MRFSHFMVLVPATVVSSLSFFCYGESEVLPSGVYRYERKCDGDRRVEANYATNSGRKINSDAWLKNEDENTAVRRLEQGQSADEDKQKILRMYELLARGGSFSAEMNRIRLVLTITEHENERKAALDLLKEYERLGSESAKLYSALYYLEHIDSYPSLNQIGQLDRLRGAAGCSEVAKIAYAQHAVSILDADIPEWEDAVNMLELQFKQGVVSSGAILGQVLYKHSESSGDKLFALRLILEAANKGEVSALNWLGREIRRDAFVASQAKEFVEAVAIAGNTRLAVDLAHANNAGGAMQSSPEVVVRWFRTAADQGDPQGQFNYALALAAGWGVDKNKDLARNTMEAAAEAGYPPAQEWLVENLMD